MFGALIVAAASSLLGSIGVLVLNADTTIVLIIAVTMLFGVATGATNVGNQAALYVQADPRFFGTAAGLLRTPGYLGSMASSAIMGLVFTNR